METICEVIGWLHVEADKAQMLVREESGHVCLQAANAEDNFSHQAIQTGTFRRGKPILDPVTQQLLGYEMESIPNAVASLA
jgi:hypothetical protein